MTRRYVLTGAPGSGKTTLLQALSARGWSVVPEAATDVIHHQQLRGCAQPWLSDDFVSNVLAVQRWRQQAAGAATVQVYDRSPVCTLALARFLRRPVPSALAREVERVVRDGVYDGGVFLVRPLGFIERTAARQIDYPAALEFEAVHVATYLERGFTLVDVPPASVADRLAVVEAQLRSTSLPRLVSPHEHRGS